MVTSIAESISNQTSFFRSLLATEDKDICIPELVKIFDCITDELMIMSEMAKTYSQEQAIIDLQSHYDLMWIVGEFLDRVEPLNYFGSEDLKTSSINVWDGLREVEHEVGDTAYLCRKSDRERRHALIESRMCETCPHKSRSI